MGKDWTPEDLDALLRSRPDITVEGQESSPVSVPAESRQRDLNRVVYLDTPREKVLSEHIMQTHLFNWVERLRPEFPDLNLYVSYPIGGFRHKTTAKKIKAEGGSADVPDTLGFVNRRGYNGLAMELKVGYNKPTDGQQVYLERLAAEGWYACVSWSLDACKDVITWYFNLPTQTRMF